MLFYLLFAFLNMDMEAKKRKLIYSEEEKVFLKKCILENKYFSNKKSDKVSNAQKAKGWEEITNTLNSQAQNNPVSTCFYYIKLFYNVNLGRQWTTFVLWLYFLNISMLLMSQNEFLLIILVMNDRFLFKLIWASNKVFLSNVFSLFCLKYVLWYLFK